MQAAAIAETADHPDAVALWNPNAAAWWSIIFTPVFGAYLHALNWRALGDADREHASMNWVVGGGVLLVLFLIVDVVVPDGQGAGEASHAIEFAFLAVWYLMSGHAQARLVKEKFGGDYPRMPWRKPLLMGLAGFGIYIGLLIASAAVIGMRYL